MPVDKITQHLHTISAQLNGIDTRLAKVEADLDAVKRSVGESHAFIKPETPKAKAKPKAKAEPSLRQRWKEAKQFVKANGLGEAFYEAWKSFCKTHKLPKAQEKQVYFKNYLACFDEFVA